MRQIFVLAILVNVWSGCNDNGSTSAPTSVVLDLSAAAATPADMVGTTPTPFPTTASVTVGAGGALAFSPQTVNIVAGGTVTWNWAAGNTLLHNVTSGDAVPAFAPSPTQMSGSFQVTFPTAGSFFYFCSVHGRNIMNGTVVVH